MIFLQRTTCMQVVVTGTAEDQRFASPSSHDLYPLPLFPTLVSVQILEGSNVMHLDLLRHARCPTDFTYLRQESFFEFRSVVPVRPGPVFGVCLGVPGEWNPSPGCYQWWLSLAWHGDLKHLPLLPHYFDFAAIAVVRFC